MSWADATPTRRAHGSHASTGYAATPVPAVPPAVPPAVQPAAPPAVQQVAVPVTPPLDLDRLLALATQAGASDLHMTVGAPPTLRVRGAMVPMPDLAPLEARELRECLYAVLTESQRKVLEETRELDLAHSVHGVGRFRVNMFWQREALGAVLRMIPWEIKPLENLGMPPVLGGFANLKRGLVLVTGPTGSGKSTTLAAIVDQVNRTRRGHIMTVEDPIEFLHSHRGCIVNQREVGVDTQDFQHALKHVLRQDPDVILVGELRDLETIAVAISAAETGHLVLATLHTQSAQDTVSRVVDVFPAQQQQQIRTQLAATLQAVVCQTLVPSLDGRGRVPAVEVMVCTEGIRAMIRDDKLQQIPGALQAGGRQGMQTLNAHLAEHVRAGRISQDSGLEYCSNIGDFVTLLGGSSQAASHAAAAGAHSSNPGGAVIDPTSRAVAAGGLGSGRPDGSDVWRVASTQPPTHGGPR